MTEPLEIVSFDQNTFDVVIKTADREFYVHKSVLAARSSFFKEVFESRLEESPIVIKMDDFSIKIVQELLNCLYTNKIAPALMDQGLMLIADEYKCVDIKEALAKYCCSQLTESNAIEYLQLGEEAHSKILFDACVKILGPKFSEILSHDDILFDQETSDVVIKAPDGEFVVHKAILMARSPVFKAMFDNPMEERNTNIIHINDFNVRSIKELVNFMYTNSLHYDCFGYMLSYNELREIILIADKYQCTSMKTHCEETIIADLNNNNAIEYLQLGEEVHSQFMIDACIKYVSDNFTKIDHNGQLINLVNPQTAQAILAMQGKKVEELSKELQDRKRKNSNSHYP